MNQIRLTKNGRKLINKQSKTPLYSKPIEVRMKVVKNQLLRDNLSVNLSVSERVWNSIQLQARLLSL